MEKIGKRKIICSLMGCCGTALEDTDPPVCDLHAHEKTASEGPEYGLKAAAEMSEQLWGPNKDVQHEKSAEQ